MKSKNILDTDLGQRIEQNYDNISKNSPFIIRVGKQQRKRETKLREIQTHIITNIKYGYVRERLQNFINHWIERTKKIEGYYDKKDRRYKVSLLG